VRGFTATIKLGINAESKEEAEEEAKRYIKPLENQVPIWLESVE